jgi:hypothetical protein
MLSLIFWKKDSGNYMTHSNGLTEEQCEVLRSLKPGDRLIIMPNNRKTKDTDYALKLMKYGEKKEDII